MHGPAQRPLLGEGWYAAQTSAPNAGAQEPDVWVDTGHCHKNKHLKTVLEYCCTGQKTVKANFESFTSVESEFLGMDREQSASRLRLSSSG